jgi:hypothetical protein
MLIKTSFIFIVLYGCATLNALSIRYNQQNSVFKTTDIESTSETIHEPLPSGFDSNNIIYHHLSDILQKRAIKQQKTFAVNTQLCTAIVAQIKARIHTQITSKISASVSQLILGGGKGARSMLKKKIM